MNSSPAPLETHYTVSDPDIALMLCVQRDEPGAWQRLIERHWPRVFGRFYRQFRDRQGAEDLVQDVFLRIFRNRKRYRPTAKFDTWLFHISRNVARNALRSQCRRPNVPMGLFEQGEDPASARGQGAELPFQSLEREETARVVRQAIALLRDRQRRAIELQCLDHSYGEIAAALAMTPKAAKSLLYRARNELRQTLSPYVESLS